MDSQGVNPSLAPLAIAIAIALLCGCQEIITGPPDDDGGVTSLALHGRVVNFETCAGGNGCRPVEGVRVRLRQLPAYVSDPTEPPGRFVLPVPPTHEDDVLVDPDGFPYAQTLNPWAAPPVVSDVYQLELLVMPVGTNPNGSQTILTALSQQTPPINLLTQGAVLGEGGYLGQVLRRDELGNHAVTGARVEVILDEDWPADVEAPEVRYLQSLPLYAEGPLLYPEGATATGPFGVFVIPTRQQTAMITVHVETSDTIFTEVIAPVAPGMVTVAIHTP